MYNCILVPLDGSKRAERILPHVRNLAKQNSATAIFITVVRPPDIIYGDSAALMGFPDQLKSYQETMKLYLNGIKGDFSDAGIDSKATVVLGSVVDEILKVAEKERVDLVAIASHGRSGLQRVFYGSVAAGILNRIDRPLLIIRSK